MAKRNELTKTELRWNSAKKDFAYQELLAYIIFIKLLISTLRQTILATLRYREERIKDALSWYPLERAFRHNTNLIGPRSVTGESTLSLAQEIQRRISECCRRVQCRCYHLDLPSSSRRDNCAMTTYLCFLLVTATRGSRELLRRSAIRSDTKVCECRSESAHRGSDGHSSNNWQMDLIAGQISCCATVKRI